MMPNHNTHHDLSVPFANPPREFGMMPFWFWNDDLDDQEILDQIRAFHAMGFGGFSPQARIGLSRRIGYLTPEFFRLVRLAVEEAARLNMKVILYDEGAYPSGSAQGRVVAENPDFAARCLIPVSRRISGPAQGYWRPNPGRALRDELVGVVQARESAGGALDPASLTRLETVGPGMVRYDLPAGEWRLVAIWHTFSGGVIRGVFPEEEDGHVQAPAAADILNPDAIAAFLRHTHDRYYEHLADYFGDTIVAMFTDEPSVLGRAPQRGPDPWPYTPGFLADIEPNWHDDPVRWLPALWLDCGEQGEAFRQVYTRAVYDRLERVFYAAQRRWCADHGIALTGHPTGSGEFGVLRQFQWPGQDMVWRWVTPASPSALEGEHSTAPKCAASAAIIQGSQRCATELFGAYGWQLTLDEAKWLLDWQLVRGVNLYYPHACFYSIRGRRAYESEPDIGIHNVWWPYFGLLSNYTRRLCWLLCEAKPVRRVAVLTDPNAAAWSAAKVLYRNQLDFFYIGPRELDEASVDGGVLIIGEQRVETVILDVRSGADGLNGSLPLEPAHQAKLSYWQTNGGVYIDTWTAESLTAAITAEPSKDLHWPDAPNVRLARYRLGRRRVYFLVNEGESAIDGPLSLAGIGKLECWDPMSGEIRPWPARVADGRIHTTLRLERRQGLVLVVDPDAEPSSAAMPTPPMTVTTMAELSGPWQTQTAEGDPLDLQAPGDWARQPGWETFSGTICYRTQFQLNGWSDVEALFLDLGSVGDIAEVIVNGQTAGVLGWAPYHVQIGHLCREGGNELEVRVTNSMANYYEGLQAPSGLMGPVALRGVG